MRMSTLVAVTMSWRPGQGFLCELESKLLKGWLHGGLYKGLLYGLFRGILGVKTIAHVVHSWVCYGFRV